MPKTVFAGKPQSRRGFTLLELTLVLGIMGFLLVGLFQLTSASSRQINNQITAQQLQLYTKAVKSWISGSKNDANGTAFGKFLATGASDGTLTTAVDGVYDVTPSVQGFKKGQLPVSAPNGATYKVVMKRTADLGGRGSFVIVVSVTGGSLSYDRLQLSNIAMFTGAEGAGIYATTDLTTPGCTTGTANAIGAFGGVCYNVDSFGLQAGKPATLAFVNILDIANSDSNYLWRVIPANPEFNSMTVDMSMGTSATPKTSTSGSPDILFNGVGDIAMDGGRITGVSGGIQTGGGSITTGNGSITTTNGAISSGGATISTGGGSLNLGDSAGTPMSISVNPTGYTGTTPATPSVYMPSYMEGVGANFTGTVEANGFNARQFIYTSSDRNLKKDIQDLHDVLPSLARLNGKRYTLKSSDHTDLGLIAQDVQAVFPELVSEHNGHLVMNYQGMVAPLVTGLNELAAENAALNARVTRLESLLNAQLQKDK